MRAQRRKKDGNKVRWISIPTNTIRGKSKAKQRGHESPKKEVKPSGPAGPQA